VTFVTIDMVISHIRQRKVVMTKVIILSQQGSGTNFLRSLLNSHPEIFISDELFVRRKDGSGSYQQAGRVSVRDFLDQHFSETLNDGLKVIGFDLKYCQITDEIIQYISDENIKIIQLTRDPMRAFIKCMKRDKTYSREDIVTQALIVHKNVHKYQEMFKHDGNFRIISYEEMTGGKIVEHINQVLETQLLAFLGLPYKHLVLTGKMKTEYAKRT